MNQALQDLGEYIAGSLPEELDGFSVARDELMVTARTAGVRKVMRFLRDDSQCLFKCLVDVCGVDFPERERRFDVVYNMLSVAHNQRIRVKLPVAESEAVPSVSSLFPTANWFERETWDLYGIYFSDHPDLRRLLTDYGFEGHPLRKDFPLTGHVEVRYDDEQQRVVYEPVRLPQEFRTFDFLSPWEGMTRHLPGDEKAETAEEGDG